MSTSPNGHAPQLGTVSCDDCWPDRPGPGPCPGCGSELLSLDPVAICAQDGDPWPCPTIKGRPDEAVLAWAADNPGFVAAAEIALNSRLREKLLPTYLDWSPYRLAARPDWDALEAAVDAREAHLSGSEHLLLQLAANLAHGNSHAGAGLDLTRLSSLDRRHRRVVLSALTTALAAPR